jgi:hypothetical protein
VERQKKISYEDTMRRVIPSSRQKHVRFRLSFCKRGLKIAMARREHAYSVRQFCLMSLSPYPPQNSRLQERHLLSVRFSFNPVSRLQYFMFLYSHKPYPKTRQRKGTVRNLYTNQTSQYFPLQLLNTIISTIHIRSVCCANCKTNRGTTNYVHSFKFYHFLTK